MSEEYKKELQVVPTPESALALYQQLYTLYKTGKQYGVVLENPYTSNQVRQDANSIKYFLTCWFEDPLGNLKKKFYVNPGLTSSEADKGFISIEQSSYTEVEAFRRKREEAITPSHKGSEIEVRRIILGDDDDVITSRYKGVDTVFDERKSQVTLADETLIRVTHMASLLAIRVLQDFGSYLNFSTLLKRAGVSDPSGLEGLDSDYYRLYGMGLRQFLSNLEILDQESKKYSEAQELLLKSGDQFNLAYNFFRKTLMCLNSQKKIDFRNKNLLE